MPYLYDQIERPQYISDGTQCLVKTPSPGPLGTYNYLDALAIFRNQLNEAKDMAELVTLAVLLKDLKAYYGVRGSDRPLDGDKEVKEVVKEGVMEPLSILHRLVLSSVYNITGGGKDVDLAVREAVADTAWTFCKEELKELLVKKSSSTMRNKWLPRLKTAFNRTMKNIFQNPNREESIVAQVRAVLARRGITVTNHQVREVLSKANMKLMQFGKFVSRIVVPFDVFLTSSRIVGEQGMRFQAFKYYEDILALRIKEALNRTGVQADVTIQQRIGQSWKHEQGASILAR
jgi:hypothetical protein